MGNNISDEVQKLVNPKISDKILEVGGGTGRIVQHFVDHTEQVWVLDPSIPMLIEARKRYPNLKIVHGYAEDQPFPTDYFDWIIVYDSFHHWDNYQQSLNEISRVLKPDGTFFIAEIHPHHRSGYFISLMEKLFKMDSTFFTPAKLSDMLTKRYFIIKSTGWIEKPTYYILSRLSA